MWMRPLSYLVTNSCLQITLWLFPLDIQFLHRWKFQIIRNEQTKMKRSPRDNGGITKAWWKKKRKMALFGPNLKWKETQTDHQDTRIVYNTEEHLTSELKHINIDTHWQEEKYRERIKMLQLCCNSKKRMVAAVALLAGWRGFPDFILFRRLELKNIKPLPLSGLSILAIILESSQLRSHQEDIHDRY